MPKRKVSITYLELMLHLQLVPFLDLGLEFDALPLLREARALETEFVIHRDYLQPDDAQKAWRSLALRSVDGDPGKTLPAVWYQPDSVYEDTEITKRAPETTRFLKSLIRWPESDRIRFMSLGPQGLIKSHRDSDVNPVHLSLNISLNMPGDCEFWIDLSKSGKKTAYSKRLPFKNKGSALLVNTSSFHALRNSSSTTRYHLIAMGPLKMTANKLLALARRQNKVAGLHAVAKALETKHQSLGF